MNAKSIGIGYAILQKYQYWHCDTLKKCVLVLVLAILFSSIINNTDDRLLLHTGFVQNSDCGFPDFSRTKLLLFSDFSKHFVHLYVNKEHYKIGF